MVKRGQGRYSFMVDFTALETALGGIQALEETVQEQRYLDDLLEAAFNDTEEAFNAEAAAFALAGGAIKHMYEWGTAGINRGRSSVRPNPMSPTARLWATNLTGHGLDRVYSYYFRPSLAVVPKPTVRDTGMSAEAISNLRDHVFWNKAQVFETGQAVRIVPVQAKFLIQPFYKGNIPSNARGADIKRGYTVSKGPNVFRPGAAVAGNFTNFWLHYWENQGQAMVNEHMEGMVRIDFERDIMRSRRGTLKRVVPGALAAGMKKEQQRIERNARRRAAYRARKGAVKNGN